MKRAATLSVLVCLLAVTAAAPASPDAGRRPDRPHGSLLDTVPKKGVLKVCTTGDYAPFTQRDPKDGTYRGVDVSMARDLARSLDAKPEFTATTWARLTGDVAARRCDIGVGGVSITLPRARQVSFSEPTREDGKTPIVRCADKDEFGEGTLADIDRPGTTVIVNPGGTNEEFTRANIERATIRLHPENTTIFEEIVAGRADVMMTDASETLYQSTIHPELCALHPEKPFTFSEKAYATPRGDADFREYVDQFVHLAVHDGTYATYEAEWMK
ncbi:transporter substrate-binding domain-containing protein [Streptomyces alfalfae]|uniref:ABC transporter substrate-binding protein n=1 Tax=Streptomyces alfalfae TaxID=1642299 RepID=A0ABM6H0G9_9ACTN|nr:transporter substrate-binding domain-containing protein [Streptomyces alfalfae]APY89466.1 ABC transporter substrate-binding protein [Streptomyces alfalfae]QUI30504.1 transporter substrate-binding domain-containing protein [Streptomyces alfalfae]